MEAMLPKVHGFELCQRITSERNSQATVFIMTGVYKDRVYRTEALRTYGAAEYFEKPLKMAELLASIAAVLGKPEPSPSPARAGPAEATAAVAAAPAQPVRETKTEPAPAEPRRREKPRSDEDMFSLPADLDRLEPRRSRRSRSRPRSVTTRRPKRSTRRSPTSSSNRWSTNPRSRRRRSRPSRRTGTATGTATAGNARSTSSSSRALAGLDLEKEKVKAPKPVPTPPPTVAFKPKVRAASGAGRREAEGPGRARPGPGNSGRGAPRAATKNTLTPGDPGSDISPFFTPGKPKPEAPVEKPKIHAAPTPPVKPRPPAPAKPEAKATEAEVIASTDLFGTLEETKTRKGPATLVLVGVSVAALAVAGFFVLRPKNSAPKTESLQTQPAAATANIPAPACR